MEKYLADDLQELAETCELAVTRLQYLKNGGTEPKNIYNSTDPAPPSKETDVTALKRQFFDENESIYERYRAMFALRDINTDESVRILNEGITSVIINRT